MLPFSYLDLHNLCFRGYADKLKFDDLIKENEGQGRLLSDAAECGGGTHELPARRALGSRPNSRREWSPAELWAGGVSPKHPGKCLTPRACPRMRTTP